MAQLKAVVFENSVSGLQIVSNDKLVFSSHDSVIIRTMGNTTQVYHGNHRSDESNFTILVYLTLNNNVIHAFLFQEQDGFLEMTIPSNCNVNPKFTTLQVKLVCFDIHLQRISETCITTKNKFLQHILRSPKEINNFDRFRGKFMHLTDPYFWDSEGNASNISWQQREVLKCYDNERYIINEINNLFTYALMNNHNCSLEDFTETHVNFYFHNFDLSKWIKIINDKLQIRQSNITVIDEKQSVADPNSIPRLMVNDAYYLVIRNETEIIGCGILLPSSHFTLTLHELKNNNC